MKRIFILWLLLAWSDHLIAQKCCVESEQFKPKSVLKMFCQILENKKGDEWKETYNTKIKNEKRRKRNKERYPLCMYIAKALSDTNTSREEHLDLVDSIKSQFYKYIYTANENLKLDEEGNFVINRRTCIKNFIQKLKEQIEETVEADSIGQDQPTVIEELPQEKPEQDDLPVKIPEQDGKPTKYLIYSEPIEDSNNLVETVYFRTDKWKIDLNYKYNKAVLEKVINLLKQCKNCKVKVYGYTDDSGSKNWNEKLSKDRAMSLIQYLKEQDVDIGNFDVMYFGEMGSGKDNARKVEIHIYGLKDINP